MKKSVKSELLRIVKFLIFSCGAELLALGVFTFFNEVTAFKPWQSHLIGHLIGVSFCFVVNKEFTFKSSDNAVKCLALVLAFFVVFTALSTLAMDFLSKHINEYIVEGILLIAHFSLEYLYCRFVVYRGSMDSKHKHFCGCGFHNVQNDEDKNEKK